MSGNQIIQVENDAKIGQLKAILYLLQTYLEGFKSEVDKSYELLKIGELDDFSKKIETTINNPFGNIIEISKEIDDKAKLIIDSIVKSYFRSQHSIIHSAYKSSTSTEQLFYSIVLRDDNIENRNKIFEFLEKFDLLNISNRYPIYFQFTPLELVDKIKIKEEIKI